MDQSSAFVEAALEQVVSPSGCPTEDGGTISLQLLEFKTHLLEVVEELHIRRNAEERFEDQISKLVLEKQELEWEKESLQNQIETTANQNAESLSNVKKQFQAKLRTTEEEKGKYQVIAELKDKEINSLKEELKALQLLKYNLEKKSNELEQKLSLQSRFKDSHLNQLGEVEKRFNTLSRQCVLVKQAHEKLEQNVDEAMRINKKLTSANEKQEATIASLKKELDEVSTKLIKAKMTSIRQIKTHNPAGREQQIQQLHLKLNMEIEMNQKLREENAAERAEKQEVIKSLQQTQQLLWSQTQTVKMVELELQSQTEKYQALKQDHEEMLEKSKATQEEVVRLTENEAESTTSWNKEKSKFLDLIQSEQKELQSLKEAYDDLHEKHSALSLQTKSQAQHITQLEMRLSTQSLVVSSQLLPAVMEEIRGGETLNEPISSSKQNIIDSEVKNPDSLDDRGAETKLDGADGEQELLNHHQQPEEIKKPINDENMQICQLTTNIPNQKSDKSDDLQINNVYCSITASVAKFIPLDGSVEQNDEGNIEVGENGGKADLKQENNIEDEKRHTEKEEDGKPTAKTSQTDIREDCEGSGKDAEKTSNPKTETKDRGDTDEVNEGGQTSETAETLIASQTTADRTTEQSSKLQVNDFMDDESGLSVGETSNFSQHLSQNMIEKVSSHEIRKDGHSLCSDEHQSDNQEPNSIIQEVSELLNQSSSSEMNAAPLPGQSDVIQELEMSREQTETCILTDNTTDTKQKHEMSDTCVRKMAELHPQSQETSKQEESVVNDDKNGDCEGQSNVDKDEDKTCETGQTPKDAGVDITMAAVDLDSGSCRDHVKSNKTEDSGDVKTTKSEKDQASGSSKHHDHHLFRETLFDDSLPTTKTYRPLFDWSKTKSDVLQQSVQGSSFSSEPNLTDPGGFLGHPSCTIPAFLKSKHSKGPLVIMRASDLLNASSVSGTSASSLRKRRQDGWKAAEEMYRQTTADMDGRVPSSCSKRSSSDRSSRASTSAAGPSSESELSFSQDREDQQSSFRAQISKIEQFLNTERLRLPKRRRNEN